MCRKASVCQIAIDMAPLTQTSVIEHLQFVSDDEGNNATAQTLLEHNKTPHTTITILERVNLFETDMKVKDIFERGL